MTANGTVLLDTELLVLLVVGQTDRTLISRHKRTCSFVEEDYDLLCGILKRYSMLLVTPNVLTEASNHASQIRDHDRKRVLTVLGRLVQGAQEEYVPSTLAASDPLFPRLGLADTATLAVAARSATVLTSDHELYLEASRAGHNVVNFNHLREAAWSRG